MDDRFHVSHHIEERIALDPVLITFDSPPETKANRASSDTVERLVSIPLVKEGPKFAFDVL
jgi:hypothetical protein